MNQNKKIYYSPKLEIVSFDEEDILTYAAGGDKDRPRAGYQHLTAQRQRPHGKRR